MTPEEKKTWTDYYAKRTKSLVDGMKSGKLKDPKAFAEWKWHAYMEDYLGCLLSVDDSIGRLMEYLDKEGDCERHAGHLLRRPGVLHGRTRHVRQALDF